MGFFSSLFKRSDEEEDVDDSMEEEEEGMPKLTKGMKLDVETPEGKHVLTGRVSSYSERTDTLVLERVPGGLSLGIQPIGTTVTVRGVNESMEQFCLKGTVEESTRMVCKLKDVRVKPIPENRTDFRLQLNVPVTVYYQADETLGRPEECTLVDISIGGACFESTYLHAMDEVLVMKVKLKDYVPMEFVGEIVRVVEYEPGKFRYGFLFAQLDDAMFT